MVVSVLEAGTVTIKNKQTNNSAYLPSDNDGQSLRTKPNNGADVFKWVVTRLDNDKYTVKNLATKQFAYVSPPPKEESQVVAKSNDIEWRIVGTGETDVYWIAPIDEDYFWGASSPVPGTPIELRKGYTDRSNNWTIKSIMASSNNAVPSSGVSSTVYGSTIPHYVAVQARYDCHPDCTPCLESTRTNILETILSWASNRAPTDNIAGPGTTSARDLPNIYWLNGLAGTGKTTIAYTVAQQCHAQGILGASFFCSRSIADCNDTSKIIPTIAYQLGLFHKPFGDRVAEVLQNDPSLLHSSVSRQLEELIVKPLASLRDLPLCVVVIDALDECSNQRTTSMALSTLLKYAELLSPLRFFVTSRPEAHIVANLSAPGYRNAYGQLLLHDVALALVTTDIHRFLAAALSEIGRRFSLSDSWPSKADIDTLSRLAGGLFVFAATAVKFIEDTKYSNPSNQLRVLTSTGAPLLDKLYLQVLHSAFPEVSKELSKQLKSILGSIVLIRDPLSPRDLACLAKQTVDTVYSSLSGLRSVLIVPEREESTATVAIRIIHPTFAEFLLDPERCTDPSFAVNSRRQHTSLLRGCLRVMRELKRDICDIRNPSLLNIKVPDLADRIAKAIPSYLQYACHHWSSHLSNSKLSDKILDALQEFAETRLMYWVEACSLLGILRDAVFALNECQRMLTRLDDNRARRVAALFYDCERLIVGFFPSISSSALQLYHSVLSFIPRETALAKTYAGERHAETSVRAVHGIADKWDACLGIVTASSLGAVTVHGRFHVSTVDFSPDGKTIVSGSDSNIRLWDALTCTLLLVLSGHTRSVNSVRYSPDGTRIVSAADDEMVKIWDSVSGVLVHTLEGHIDAVSSAVFTPDGARVVSGSWDCTIRIWNVHSGTRLAVLREHQRHVTSVAVSPDGHWAVSSAQYGEVYLWNLETPYARRIILPVAVQGRAECSAIFTTDSSAVITAPCDESEAQISVWDVSSGELLRELKPSGWSGTRTWCLSLSPAGDELACGLDGGTVLILDPSNGDVRRTLMGHTSIVLGVAYNRERTRLVSGSVDGSLRLWDVVKYTADTPSASSTRRGSDSSGGTLSPNCYSAVFSHDGSRMFLGCENSTITAERTDTWDEVYEPLPGEDGNRDRHIPCLAFSPDESAILAAGAADGETVLRIWDATTGTLRVQFPDARQDSRFMIDKQGVEGMLMWNDVLGFMPHCFGGQSSSMMFSQDSQYLVTGSRAGDKEDTTVRLWSVATGGLVREFSGHSDPVSCVAFSLNANRIATGSEDSSVIIWDVVTGASLTAYSGHDWTVTSVAFSASGALVASGSEDGDVGVWNAETGELLQSFEFPRLWLWVVKFTTVWSVAFAPGGNVVIAGASNKMFLWDVEAGVCLHVFHTVTWGRTIELAPDGTGVVVDGGRVVQLWAPLDVDVQATTTLPWLPRRTWPVYYIEDGWIFSLTPTRRARLCWVPGDWQEVMGHFSHTLVLKGRRTMDFAALNSYLDTLHSAAQ